jgi:hypothetical protein
MVRRIDVHDRYGTILAMPTWGEIQEHVRSKYTLSKDEERHFALVWEYEGGRTQQVFVRPFSAYDQDWVEFRTFVCAESEMSPRVALRKNESFVFGALALDDDGDYVMIYSAPLATLDPEELEMPLNALARVADRLEEEHTAKDDY